MKAQLCLLLELTFFTAHVFAKKCSYYPLQSDSTSAATIINKSRLAYAGLSIYLDSGKVIDSSYNIKYPHKNVKVFKTVYTNSKQFNFEFYQTDNLNSLYTINRSSDVVKTWWGITNKVGMPANLKSALVSALGISGATSVIVPSLLLVNESMDNFYTSFTSLHINESEKVGTIDCYKISCLQKKSLSPIIVWIGKKDFLIRKFEIDHKINPITKTNIASVTEVLKRDSINAKSSKGYAEAMKHDSRIVTPTALRAAIIKSLSSMPDYHVIGTYFFYPYKLKKIDPELLKFRPNREAAL